MKSSFLERLDAALELAIEPIRRACLLSEKASYLARRGDALDSTEIVRILRSDDQHLVSGEVSAWINFAEGIQFHCSGQDSDANQKWIRSLAIARSVDARSVMTRTLSWMAFIDYTNIRTESLINNTREAIKYMTKDDLEAIARTYLTVAQIFHLCGDALKAREFYEKCRLACLRSGDDVMLAALIHNMAWIRMSLQRNEILQGIPSTEDRYILELGVESTRSYERLIGVRSFDVMTPLLGAQMDILSERYENAILAISENISGIADQGLSRLNAVLLADRAYCRAKIGDTDGARSDALNACEAISQEDHVDDMAVLFTRLSQVYELAGDSSMSTMYDAKAKVQWENYKVLQNTILRNIAVLAGEIPDLV